MLLKNCDALYFCQDECKVLKKAYIGISDGIIDYFCDVPPSKDYGQVKDMSGLLVMPGLYNTHTHTPMTLLRGLGSGLPLDRWLNEVIFPIEAKLTGEDIRAGTQLALMELIAGGVVSFTDMYDFPRITADETAKAGLKANLNRPILSFDDDEKFEDNFRVKQSLEFFDEYRNMYPQLITIDFAIHAEYTSKPHIVKKYAEACKSRSARMHIHLSETRKEHEECKKRHGMTPAAYFNSLGVFDNPTTAAHCVFTEPEDWAIMKDKGVTPVHNPTSNMKLASGFMPLGPFLSLGLNVGLGTDGTASNNNLNMFEEMHLAAIIHKGKSNNPSLVSPGDILKMATINGAKSQGRSGGNIEVGHSADIIALDMSAPHLNPAHDIPALIVYSAQASDVCFNMVNGRILYENGDYLSIDKESVMQNVHDCVERLFN